MIYKFTNFGSSQQLLVVQFHKARELSQADSGLLELGPWIWLPPLARWSACHHNISASEELVTVGAIFCLQQSQRQVKLPRKLFLVAS